MALSAKTFSAVLCTIMMGVCDSTIEQLKLNQDLIEDQAFVLAASPVRCKWGRQGENNEKAYKNNRSKD